MELKEKYKTEQKKIEIKERESELRANVKQSFTDTAMKIKEANEICVALGKNIKFKPIFIKQMVDESGRSMTLMHKEGMERIWHGSIGNANFSEEL